MNIDILNEAIGGIDASIVEEVLAEGNKRTKTTVFVERPWLKWAAAAVAIVVIAAGTPLALKAIGSFRNESFVSPNGSGNGNSGVVVQADSSEPDGSETGSGSEQNSEAESGLIEGEKPVNNDSPTQSYSSERSDENENPSGGGQEHQSGSSVKPEDSGTGGEPGVEDPKIGEFIKDDMPPLTYRINGESKTFSYTVSEWAVDPYSSTCADDLSYYSIDHYLGSDGSTVLINSGSGELMQYETTVLHGDWPAPEHITSENEAIDIAKKVVLNTDIDVSGLENSEASVQESAKGYYVTLTVPEGKISVHIDIQGSLLGIYADKRDS